MTTLNRMSTNGMPRWMGQVAVMGVLLVGGFVMVAPFVWMIATSLKPAKEVFLGNFFPIAPTWDNYFAVLTKVPFARWYLNSLIVAGAVTLSVAFFDSLVGFVLAKHQFRGKNIIFVLIM